MNLRNINRVYFLGIGGIGMSALARYFYITGKEVAGYDKTRTPLTDELSSMGISVHYEEDINLIPQNYSDTENTLIVYTPAVPADHKEFIHFRDNGFKIFKRAEILGYITKDKKAVCISGTHGKTTVTTMASFLFHNSPLGCSAFLGGISKNFNSNLVLSDKSAYVVVEADEYDRSFLKLHPYIAIVTSIDADHLDIYNTHDEVIKSFEAFVSQIQEGGILIVKKGLNIQISNPGIKVYTYSLNETADFYAKNIRLENFRYIFDVVTPEKIITNVTLKHPGLVNVENAVAAISAATLAGIESDLIKQNISGFSGVKRRMDHILTTDKVIYIDDYAHHPKEIEATLNSVKKLYPERKITAIFQPHLFSRTRDFAYDFALSLSLADELFLLNIYPARELPISGVSSEIILKNVTSKEKTLTTKENLIGILKNKKIELLLTMGAGDIDSLLGPIKNMLLEKYK